MEHIIKLDGYFAAPCRLMLGTWGSYGVETIRIEASGVWEGLAISAAFRRGDSDPVTVAADPGTLCFPVPAEATAVPGKDGILTLRGISEDKRVFTTDVEFFVLNHGQMDGAPAAVPTPTEMEQLQILANTAVSKANTAEAQAEAAVSKANTAEAQAEAAVSKANTAEAQAEAAVSKANTAEAQAEAAVSKANTAGAQAEAAVSKASAAGERAERAYSAAVMNRERLETESRKTEALWKLNQGISYQFETDDTVAYNKTVPGGAKLASVERIGGETVAWNQINNLKIEKWNKDQFVVTNLESGYTRLTYVKGTYVYGYILLPKIVIVDHTYLMLADLSINDNSNIYSVWAKPSNFDDTMDFNNGKLIRRANSSGQPIIGFSVRDTSIETSIDIKDIVIIDLTKMFGSGNEPTSTDDPRIAWIEEYAAEHLEYNAGKLVSAEVGSIRYNDAVIADIPSAVRSLPGYGWSAGGVCNAIEGTDTGWQYVQRVGSRGYQEGDTVTDGTTTCYVLDEPTTTDITDLMDGVLDAITVEAGGTLTFENTAGLPVPSSVEYAVSLAEVNG